MPADFRVSITNAPGDGVYPISSFTWLLLYENPKDKAQAKVMVDFMKWALTDGQKFAPELGYAPLPAAVVKLELAALATIKDSVDGLMRSWLRSDAISAFRSGRASSRRPRRHRARHRRRAVAPVDAVDPEVRLAASGDRHLGSGGRRVRRAPVHLGHALLVGPGAADLDADRPRHRRLHLRAVPGLAADAAGLPDRAARGDSRRSSTGSGASSCSCPCVRSSRVATPAWLRRCRSSAGRRSASACCRRR